MDASQLRDALAAQPESDGTVGDRVRRGLADYFGGFDQLRDALGVQLSTPEGAGEFAAYATPGVGTALSARDTYNALGDRDWRGAALGAAGMIPLVGGMTSAAAKSGARLAEALANSEKRGITAYHGSPHDFDRFDLSKIGTGEGAQAYGHGLYFADREDIARGYRDRLSGDDRDSANYRYGDTPSNQIGDRWDAAEKAAREHVSHPDHSRQIVNNIVDALPDMPEVHARDYLKEYEAPAGFEKAYGAASEALGDLNWKHNPGHMYEVNINADPEHFLDWDKPLSQQPEHVQNALEPIRQDIFREYEDANPGLLKGPPSHIGQILSARGPESAKALSEQGIPGIKYLDQGSRAAGEGSRNYVVFDDKLVSIVKKYGIPGAIGLGLITPEIGRQMQEQGL